MTARWITAAATLILSAFAAQAQTRWRMPTEYPSSAMPGEGLRLFAGAVEAASGGKLVVEPRFEAGAEFSGASLIAALREAKVEAGDVFAGTLDGVDPLFSLSAQPFLARTLDDAHRLADLARPATAKAFAGRGLHLLYVAPWPASGIWSKRPLASPADLAGLTIRTYDATSTDVLRRAGAQATEMSFSAAMPKLREGTVDAVLSSGDGGAGRRLWEVLSHFTAVEYAYPLSFALVSDAAYGALDPSARAAVDRAAAETEAKLWALVATRLEANYARMRENGVAIAAPAPDPVVAALRAAAAPARTAWAARTPEGAAVLDAFAR